MPRNWAAEGQELARLEQRAFDRLSALQKDLQQLVADQRRLPPDLLRSLDQAASEHKAACRRYETFTGKAAVAAGSKVSAPAKRGRRSGPAAPDRANAAGWQWSVRSDG